MTIYGDNVGSLSLYKKKDLKPWDSIGMRNDVYFFAKETFHWGLNLYCCPASWLAWWWLTTGVGGLCFVLLCTFRLFLVLNCLPQSSQATTSPTCVSMWFLMFCLTWPSLPQTRHCSSPLSVCPVRLSIFLSNLAAYPSGSSSWPIRCKRWLQSGPALKLCGCYMHLTNAFISKTQCIRKTSLIGSSAPPCGGCWHGYSNCS